MFIIAFIVRYQHYGSYSSSKVPTKPAYVGSVNSNKYHKPSSEWAAFFFVVLFPGID